MVTVPSSTMRLPLLVNGTPTWIPNGEFTVIQPLMLLSRLLVPVNPTIWAPLAKALKLVVLLVIVAPPMWMVPAFHTTEPLLTSCLPPLIVNSPLIVATDPFGIVVVEFPPSRALLSESALVG